MKTLKREKLNITVSVVKILPIILLRYNPNCI